MTNLPPLPNSRTQISTSTGHAEPAFYRWFQAIHLAFAQGWLTEAEALALIETLSARVDALEGAGTAEDLLRVLSGTNGIIVSGNLRDGVEIRGPDIPTGVRQPGRDGEDGADGWPGPPGRDGIAGRDGRPGVDGADGEDSFVPGPPGRDGTIGRDGVPIGAIDDWSTEDPWPMPVAPSTGSVPMASLAASGTADSTQFLRGDGAWSNNLTGSLGINASSLTGYGLRNTLAITGTVTAYGQRNDGVVQSDVTTGANYYASGAATVASAFTLTAMRHYLAVQGTIGAGSAVTNQYGFFADASLTGATNNYGFFGNIASGTNRWNVYCAGTATNYMAGALSIGTTNAANTNLRISKNLTGAVTNYSVSNESTVLSDVTSAARGFRTNLATQNASFTLGSLAHYVCEQAAFGASSTVTSQYGFLAETSLTGATTNYGFFGNIAASGSARWNFVANGTAPNRFAGQVVIGGSTLDTTAALNVISTTQGILFPRMTETQRDAISSPTAGLVIYNTTTGKLNVRGAAAWEEITSA